MALTAGTSSNTRSRSWFLGVLFVILAGSLYWRFGPTAETPSSASNPSQPATAPATAAAAADAAAQAKKNRLPSALNFVALDQVHVERATTRNPFKFYVAPPPPPPPQPVQKAYVPPPVSTQPIGPPPPPPIPPVPLKYIGKLQQAGKTVAILTDGKAQFSGAEGGIIDGRYRIVKIGLESLQIEYVNRTGLTILPFKG